MAFHNKTGSLVRQSIFQHGQAPTTFVLNSIHCISSSKLSIGRLSWSTDDQNLKDTSANFGEITDARVGTDRDTWGIEVYFCPRILYVGLDLKVEQDPNVQAEASQDKTHMPYVD
ncbi:unnamed protein product [Dovyalis caffra]|uniref:Uncharacterized protein n=1 Tax=Dovyalis caffra TaxID=77055 RepID=A0AAV1SVZ6_9ROSI|nr:unnamed protein product [Dovyalis caffra]